MRLLTLPPVRETDGFAPHQVAVNDDTRPTEDEIARARAAIRASTGRTEPLFNTEDTP